MIGAAATILAAPLTVQPGGGQGPDPAAILATQNLTAILRPLQWVVIAFIFLFFLRVVRAVIVELRPVGPRLTRRERRAQRRGEEVPAGRPGKRLVLEVLEPEEQKGEVYELDGELVVGRAPGCAIVTDYDVYSSSQHARLYRQGDQVWVEDLGSTNGTFVNSERIVQPTRLARRDILQVGTTVFEVTR